jgi:hypothetical protein
MWRARLIAVEEGGGAVATMAGDWFLAVNAMSYLTSHHGEAEATDREDGNGQGSRVVVARHLGSQSSDTPLYPFLPTPRACRWPCSPASQQQASLMHHTTFWASMP